MKEFSRRINFFTASFIGILGFSQIGEIFHENDFEDKLDDILILLLGIVTIWWYKKTGYKSGKSVTSVIILVISVLIKIMGIYIERGDKEALGDDIGIISGLVIALIFIVWQVFSHKKEITA